MRLGVRFFTSPITFDSYGVIFSSQILAVAYYNSILRTVAGTAVTLLVTYCAGYALARADLPFRKSITALVVFTMFFNGGLVAIYLNILQLGLMNSRWALILPLATSAWNLLIARNFIMALRESWRTLPWPTGRTRCASSFRSCFPSPRRCWLSWRCGPR